MPMRRPMMAAAATSPAAMPRCSVEGALRGASAARGVGDDANQGSVTSERNREQYERGSGERARYERRNGERVRRAAVGRARSELRVSRRTAYGHSSLAGSQLLPYPIA